MARNINPESPLLSGMHELDRIDHALARKRLDPDIFERCATDILSETYPGLTPIPQGTDWGRDADVQGDRSRHPAPAPGHNLAHTLAGVQKNLVASLRSMAKHDRPVERVILANPAVLNEQQREKLRKKAREWNVTVEAIHDQVFFASRLCRDGAC